MTRPLTREVQGPPDHCGSASAVIVFVVLLVCALAPIALRALELRDSRAQMDAVERALINLVDNLQRYRCTVRY